VILRTTAVLLLLTVTLGACTRRGAQTYGGDVDVPKGELEEVTDASEASDPQLESSEAEGRGNGSFLFTFTDQSGFKPTGIPVAVQGPTSGTFLSDAGGKLRIDGPAGHYQFRTVAGCHERIEVLAGTSGTFGIAAGTTGTGSVVVEWRHRISPSPPVYSDLQPYWPPREVVTVRFDVVDHCVEGGPSRVGGVSYPTFVFQPGANIRLVGDPVLKADRDGFGYVKITCIREGKAELAIVDSKNPKERLDLAGGDSPGNYSGSAPECKEV
jgi:hypothetical protein